MGCCEDKYFQSSDEPPMENAPKDIRPRPRNNQPNENIVITVLWRRLSVFNRQSSTRPASSNVHQVKRRRNQSSGQK
ncbi:hypothetical protein H920_14542 [Fukomys damarensis]|uniref:Uncharacterized protein n=1 Tax=Fukomys damarensis TaxID=885580 RepID=A0A091CZB6_FUKDA|nr:hypothetical protein H920_14542 [Fukomys damarensis]